jgi:mannose-6-phosphate isomerase-like protein (cupin superfamily)
VSATSTILESTYLSGKVLKRSLLVFSAPPGADAPVVKRLLLPQGELAQFYDAAKPIHYLAHIELRPDSVRGNHYHEAKEELIYLVQGEILLTVQDIDSKERDSVPLATGDIVLISTRVAHALHVVKAGHAIEFSSARFDPADTYRFPLA